jgi:hydroxymethylbilane synthase
VGGKGLFVKELEVALMEKRADLAVHSCKDMPAELPPGLQLQIVDERETPFDALVLPDNSDQTLSSLTELKAGAVVGTSSLRRKCQILNIRPDLQCRDLRGNVNTRLAKLDAGDYDAIILAAAGLQRLELQHRISLLLPSEETLPAVGQGALAIELREGDKQTTELIAPLLQTQTQLCVAAERAMNHKLEGGCQVPIAGFAVIQGSELWLRGRVGAIDGSELLHKEMRVEIGSDSNAQQAAEQLGIAVATSLLQAGADRLLAMDQH